MKTVDITYRYEARDTPARPRPLDSTAALGRLNNGNRAFAALLDDPTNEHVERIISVDSRDLALGDTSLPKQRPFAAILGCSDARVPVELIFNEGPNDLFVIRVAGNGLGTEILGSLKYAVDNLRGSLKLIVVLGHSGCGALTTAVDVFLNPANYLPLVTMHSLRRILDGLLVVVQASARRFQSAFGPEISHHPRYREALIEASIVTNAALAAHSIQQEFGTSDPAELQTVYGVYLLETRQVWVPHVSEMKGIGLALAPRDPAGFIELGSAILQSDRIRSLLQP
ncbi:MAG: carbonic anhydrase [Xanthobacteraceae bacterium]|jgi:carbonic anhydrase